MPRRLRIHLAGGFYHVTLRGNHQQDIFRAAADRFLLNAITARAIESYGARVHAYCWMTNHLHFLMQVGDEPLGCVMRQIASDYARAFQRKLETTGHLFERRYHAILVDVDSYLLELLRYIHLNPVKAGLVARASQHRWSSHHAYAGAPAESWLTTNFALAMFDRDRMRAHDAYRRFVASGEAGQELDGIELGSAAILGDDRFIARIDATPKRPAPRQKLDELVAEACCRFGICEQLLLSEGRDERLVRARAWIAREASERRVASLSAVARALGRDRSTLRHAIRYYGDSVDETPKNPT